MVQEKGLVLGFGCCQIVLLVIEAPGIRAWPREPPK